MRSLPEFVQRVFSNPKLAAAVSYHASHQDPAGNLCDFQDGTVFKRAMEDAHFSSNPHNLLMGLITDGVQPFLDDAKYSMWPLAATFYNWPPWLRYTLGVTTLLGVIPGSRDGSSSLDLQPTLEIITDQLELLDPTLGTGVEVKNASTGELETVYVKLVQVGDAGLLKWLAQVQNAF